MKIIDTGVIKELVCGSVVAALCFGAPTFMEYIFPKPTAIQDVVDSMPFLGSMIIGLTIIRLLQRKKSREKNV